MVKNPLNKSQAEYQLNAIKLYTRCPETITYRSHILFMYLQQKLFIKFLYLIINLQLLIYSEYIECVVSGFFDILKTS